MKLTDDNNIFLYIFCALAVIDIMIFVLSALVIFEFIVVIM